MATVGSRIKKSRTEFGITQTELADRINTSKQQLYKYENDIITNIPSSVIEKIAHVLEISPAYLMGWADDSHAMPSSELCGTREEQEIVRAFRKADDLTKQMVLRLLNIEQIKKENTETA